VIKVFLSHQSADAPRAGQIAARLKARHDIDSYLDVIDPYINRRGEDLADHIQLEMDKCTQLLAVVSESTKHSQWVPWEIGVATEKDYPLATFLAAGSVVPEFLRKWPVLRTDDHVDQYARASKLAVNSFIQKRATLSEGVARLRSTREFFSTLRAGLGQ